MDEDSDLVPSSHGFCTGHEGYHVERVGGGGRQCAPRYGDICWVDCDLSWVELDACQEQVEINIIDYWDFFYMSSILCCCIASYTEKYYSENIEN